MFNVYFRNTLKRMPVSDISLILLGAGSSTRFGQQVKKQWLRIGHQPLWQFVTESFSKQHTFDKIIVVASEDELRYMQNYTQNVTFVEGGKQRQDSLNYALSHVQTPYVLVHDIARACLDENLISSLIDARHQADIIVPYIDASDTVVYQNNTIDREHVKLIQTPQLSQTQKLKNALSLTTIFTDDRGAIEAQQGTVHYVKGTPNAHKLTHLHDLVYLPCITKPASDTFSGFGFDVHAFEKSKQMVLCGVKIESDVGFLAHSDGDVAIHALIDALLGAIGAGDIGELFPDTDNSYAGIDSTILLQRVIRFIQNVGYTIINTDITISAQAPKLSPYKIHMKHTLASILQIDPIFVNIKATTTEGLGYVGRKEGVSVQAIANVKYYDYTIRSKRP